MEVSQTIVVRKKSLRNSDKDRSYWLSQSYATRLAALETIRQDLYQWQYDVQPRLERVHRIIERVRCFLNFAFFIFLK